MWQRYVSPVVPMSLKKYWITEQWLKAFDSWVGWSDGISAYDCTSHSGGIFCIFQAVDLFFRINNTAGVGKGILQLPHARLFSLLVTTCMTIKLGNIYFYYISCKKIIAAIKVPTFVHNVDICLLAWKMTYRL